MQIADTLETQPLTAALGALIRNVDLRRPLPPQTVGALRRAVLDHGVIFFHDQELDAGQMRTFVSAFGPLATESYGGGGSERDEADEGGDLHPTRHSTAVWHADVTFFPEPAAGAALRAVRLPRVGGDTCFAGMYAAYEALSAPIRRMLDGLTAVHSARPSVERLAGRGAGFAAAAARYGAESIHPVVRVHPETGRKALYVNECSTTRIVELAPAESASLLAMLFNHIRSPEFQVRWRWAPNDLAFWDNRCTQHFAVPDYDSERIMLRVALAGDRPVGPASA